MQFGIMLPVNRGSWSAVVDDVRRAEDAGFDHAIVGDHVQYPPGAAPLESLTALGAVAALTSTIQLAIVAAAVAFRHPAVFAKQITTLQHISGGRMRCVLGAGVDEAEHVAFGLPFGTARERMERLQDTARICREMWDTTGAVHLTGSSCRVSGARDDPASPVRTPLGFAGTGPRVRRLAAETGDEWCFGLLPDYVELVAQFSQARGETGRDVAVSAFVPVVADGAAAHPLSGHPRALDGDRERAEAQLATYVDAGVDLLYLIPVGAGAAEAAARGLDDLRAMSRSVGAAR